MRRSSNEPAAAPSGWQLGYVGEEIEFLRDRLHSRGGVSVELVDIGKYGCDSELVTVVTSICRR
jgi:hypothetical protein